MRPLFDLSDRHALVNGGLGLLGASILSTLKGLGAAVTVFDRLPLRNAHEH